MKNASSCSSVVPPSSPVKVNIFNSQYSIKPSENLTEDDIRELADYVDRLMHQASQSGAHDKLSIAIMVALNIAARMCEDQKQHAHSIRQLVGRIDEAIADDAVHDTLRALPTFDPTCSIPR
jgi:cell division protein ZapA (FtsZ GTPase activity inhibitor)